MAAASLPVAGVRDPFTISSKRAAIALSLGDILIHNLGVWLCSIQKSTSWNHDDWGRNPECWLLNLGRLLKNEYSPVSPHGDWATLGIKLVPLNFVLYLGPTSVSSHPSRSKSEVRIFRVRNTESLGLPTYIDLLALPIMPSPRPTFGRKEVGQKRLLKSSGPMCSDQNNSRTLFMGLFSYYCLTPRPCVRTCLK